MKVKMKEKVYKLEGIDNIRMFPSDLTGSLDVFFSDNFAFLGGEF